VSQLPFLPKRRPREARRILQFVGMSDPRKRIVEAGYDAMADGYLSWGRRVAGDPRARFLEEFSRRLPDGARVLDLGCGAGVPSTQLLAERFEVVGVDISQAQLRLAKKNVPQASFIRADLSELSFPDAGFAGITALYSISHVPREEHGELFRRTAAWLEPGGLLLATLGAGSSPDWTGEWLGVPMFFSSYDAETNKALLEAAGFELLHDEVVETHEPEGAVSFLWTLARKSR
jgi:SAM-dependent methyltransferase